MLFLTASLALHALFLGLPTDWNSKSALNAPAKSGLGLTDFSVTLTALVPQESKSPTPKTKPATKAKKFAKSQVVQPPTVERQSSGARVSGLVREFLEKNKSYPSSARARQEEGKVIFELIQNEQHFSYRILQDSASLRLNQSARELFQKLLHELNNGELKRNLPAEERAALVKSWEVVYQLNSTQL